MIVRRDSGPMPSGTNPLPPGPVAQRRADASAVSAALDRAQQAYNSLTFRSSWDWRRAGINTMKDVARSNQQRFAPGIFPPFGGPVPPAFFPKQYPPGVLTPLDRGVSAGPSAQNPGGGTANGMGEARGRRAGRDEVRSFPGRFSAAKSRGLSGAPGTGGSGAGTGLIGAPFTQSIPPKGAPNASVQPAGGGSNAPSTTGPNGSQGFTGRTIICDAPAAGVQILGPNTGTADTPEPKLTIGPQPAEPPVLPLSMRPGRGLSGAYPMNVGCSPTPGVALTTAVQQDDAAAVAEASAGDAGAGSTWWAWLLVIGLAVVAATSGDDEKRETRGHAKR
jgi:hypothetical protein